MSSAEGYILNAVQTPGPLYPVYKSVASGQRTKEAIKADAGIDSNLDATLDGLRLLRLVGREDGEYYTSDYKWDTGSDERDFKLTALHNLAQECDEGEWGKQAVALLNYGYLLEEDVQYFENNEEPLYDAIDDWFSSIGYQPQSQQGRITHNDNKFANWTRLMHFLGLVHKVRGREHTVYPDPDLVRTSLELAVDDRGIDVDGAPGIEIEQYLRWLRGNLLYVTTTSDGQVPEGLARVLFELVRDNEIEVVEYGDAGAIGLGGVPPYDGIDNEANTIKLV
ncbi:hypothetical protein [Halobacterium sp. R2-5]|uniref:hypothetical protein n=1 Tax=Halobacterium sp. R2-5 TaxID=2715751 RepID=UPI00141FBBDC|nr:hypothetical protein [Halobacterium sp. R2-5]NIC00940.1 hypothetical protein [Halobacterium sp. R2-5]